VIVDREFFLSFIGADRSWAVWLLAELDAAGYSSVSQVRDFVAGANFAVAMDRAARRARRTLGVLSAAALQAPYMRQEWAQRLAADPTGEQRELVLVRVEPCDPAGLLGPVVYIGLVGLDEAAARARLREELAAAVGGQRPLVSRRIDDRRLKGATDRSRHRHQHGGRCSVICFNALQQPPW
jgi:TIR domain